MNNDIMKLVKDEKGATTIEYALLIVAVLLVVAVGFRALGTTVNATAQKAAAAVK
ncbi:MAG TPA: Flp family type IVb pilin [Polyangiaceae bacterium]|nr:Flp family type IVb pilin [Polyangiaceae bacterium]